MIPAPEELVARIQAMLDDDPTKPWCVHRIRDQVATDRDELADQELLFESRRAADLLVATGQARREAVSTVAIGVHCEDSVYWSSRSRCQALEEFGPEYESPAILYRLASHFECHGL
jgi:hypothetical protein